MAYRFGTCRQCGRMENVCRRDAWRWPKGEGLYALFPTASKVKSQAAEIERLRSVAVDAVQFIDTYALDVVPEGCAPHSLTAGAKWVKESAQAAVRTNAEGEK